MADSDIKGSKDNSLIKRYEGSSIQYYENKAYQEFKFLLGPLPKDQAKTDDLRLKSLEGAYTRLVYLIPQGRSTLEVLRNYQNEVKAKNGKLLYECKDQECGATAVGAYIYPPSNIIGGERSAGGCLIATFKISDQRYSSMTFPDSGSYISVLSYVINDTLGCDSAVGKTIAIVDIIQPKVIDQKMVVVQASEMASSISSTGKVALYGIHFDTSKSDIKSESDTTLEQMAKLLKSNPSMRVLIVGHTDNVGGFSANIELSQKRASAVALALSGKYGVNKDRLSPIGVSFASPIASNANDEGRSKNRRVELVENVPFAAGR